MEDQEQVKESEKEDKGWEEKENTVGRGKKEGRDRARRKLTMVSRRLHDSENKKQKPLNLGEGKGKERKGRKKEDNIVLSNKYCPPQGKFIMQRRNR